MKTSETDSFLRKAIPPEEGDAPRKKEIQKVLKHMERKVLIEDLILSGLLHPLHILLNSFGSFLDFVYEKTKRKTKEEAQK